MLKIANYKIKGIKKTPLSQDDYPETATGWHSSIALAPVVLRHCVSTVLP